MRRQEFGSEAEMATAAMEILRSQGYTVYPELGGIDMIATTPDMTYPIGKRIIAIQAKLSVNLSVMLQAWDVRGYANEAWIMVPHRAWYRLPSSARTMLRKLDIGVFIVKKTSRWTTGQGITPEVQLQTIVVPEGTRYVDNTSLLELMVPRAETWTVPGRPAPKQFTHFRRDEITMEEWIATHPGCSIEDALRSVHNYGTNKRTGKPKAVPRQEVERFRERCGNLYKGWNLVDDKLYVIAREPDAPSSPV